MHPTLLRIPVGAKDAGKEWGPNRGYQIKSYLFVASTQNPELLLLVKGRPDLCLIDELKLKAASVNG